MDYLFSLWNPVMPLDVRLFFVLFACICISAVHILLLFIPRLIPDSRSLFEQLCFAVAEPLINRLDRPERSARDLIIRGAVFLILMMLFWGVLFSALLYIVAKVDEGYLSYAFLLMLLICISPLKPAIALLKERKALKNQDQSQGALRTLARSSSSNLIHLDEHGTVRIAVSTAIESVYLRLFFPLFWFLAGGGKALIFAMIVQTICVSFSHRANVSNKFSTVPHMILFVLSVVPAFLAALFAALASVFSPRFSIAGALKGVLHPTSPRGWGYGDWILSIAGYATNTSLGGPRQTLSGEPVARPWLGPKDASAKHRADDIPRFIYWNIVAVFLILLSVYALNVFTF